MTTSVRIEELESVPLAVIRRQVSASDLSPVVPECCGLVWKAVRAQQVKAGRHVALYWDGGIRLEVGVELHEPFADHGDVVCSVRQWCATNHRQLAGPSWEIYGHWQQEWNADPSRIQTDVFYLLTDGLNTRNS